MKNPNVCRKIMYALIFSGLIIANGSAVLFGTDTMSPGFIMGGFVAVIGIVFGFLTVRCPHCGKLLNLKGWDTEYCSHCGESVVLEKALAMLTSFYILLLHYICKYNLAIYSSK